MTIDQAIYILKNSAFLSTGSEFQDIEKAIEMSVEALERQSPKKITVRNDHDLFCPVCGESVVWDMKWCDNCGQRIFIGGDMENNGK